MRPPPKMSKPLPGQAVSDFIKELDATVDWIKEAVEKIEAVVSPPCLDDCPSLRGGACDCGAEEERARFDA